MAAGHRFNAFSSAIDLVRTGVNLRTRLGSSQAWHTSDQTYSEGLSSWRKSRIVSMSSCGRYVESRANFGNGHVITVSFVNVFIDSSLFTQHGLLSGS